MHNIEHYSYDENIKRDWVQQKLDAYVKAETYHEGGHGLDKPIRWLDSEPICPDYDTAITVIEKRDRGWYDQLAVRYYEPAPGFTSKKYTELREKTRAAYDAYLAKNSIWARGLKSEYVGCKKCGSKLKREYINTNKCPVCHAELRPESTLKSVEAAQARWKKAQAVENAYKNDHAKKKVMWLVKIEYHT